jgi:hypothetical protein
VNVPPGETTSGHILPVEIRTEDGTVVRLGVAHIGPVHVTGGAVDHQAVRQLSTFLDDRLEIGTIGICGQDSSACDIEEEETADFGVGPRCGSRLGGL